MHNSAMVTLSAAFATRRSGVRASSRPPQKQAITQQTTVNGGGHPAVGRHGSLLFVRTVHVAFTLLILLGGSASAQESHGLRRYKLPVTLLAGAASTDVSSTLLIAHYNRDHPNPGFRTEQNPLVGWMEPRLGTPVMLAVGAAIEATAVVVACKLLCESHPKLMKWGLLTGAAAHGTAATNNLRIHYGR